MEPYRLKGAASVLRTVGLMLVLAMLNQGCAEAQSVRTSDQGFKVDTLVSGLRNPWGMAFLPNGDLLITERPGRLRLVRDGELVETPIRGLPLIREVGQGGLLGIALHPEFAENRLVYLAYAGNEEGRYNTEVLRGEYDGAALRNVEVIFKAVPKVSGGRHFGARLVFAPDGTLFVSLGDRGASPSNQRANPAQQLDNHIGTLIRINDDGTVPEDNPFVGRSDVRPEIYTYGNRNMQGMALHPETKQIWTHEHGPQGGDELNIMRAGVNYGWPIITYGANYGLGSKIGEGTHKDGMAQPVYNWVPSIAPSGMTFYTGDALPGWKGDLFVGSLKFGVLVRLEMEGDRIVGEERLASPDYGRVRDVVQGPDGNLYLLTDHRDGRLLRVSAAR